MNIKHIPYNVNKLKSTISKLNMFGELLNCNESPDTLAPLMIGYTAYVVIKQLGLRLRAIFA